MAFHIERTIEELGETRAFQRLVTRIKDAIKKKNISKDQNINEFNLAVVSLKQMEKNGNPFSVNTAVQDVGLGARIRSQIIQDILPTRVGVLPDKVKIPDSLVVEDKIDFPMSRAAEFANQIGDRLMFNKFRTIAREAQDMERVATEYIENLRVASRQNKGLPSGFDRIVLEQIVEDEKSEKAIAEFLHELMDKPLSEIFI